MILDRTQSPKIHDAVDFNYVLPPIQTISLQNGLPLHALNAGVQEVVEVDWVFPAGIWFEEKPGVAQATAALLKSGTKEKTSQQINEAFEYYGANLQVSCGNDFAMLSLYTLSKHLPKLLPIVEDILNNSIFPEEELKLYQQNSVQKLLVSLRQCEFVANQKIDAAIFGEAHPYGRFSKKENIEAITREDLLSYYRSHFTLANTRMFISGKIGDVELKAVEDVFGKAIITNQSLQQKTIEKHPSAERKQFITNDANGVQGAIRIGREFINRHHEDFAPMVVLNTLFGGYFGSRLMSNIREEKGYTYGIYSSQSPFQNAGALTIYTEVGKDVIDDAVKEIYFEMDKLSNKLVSNEELLLVKNYLLGNLLGDLDGPFQIIQRWRTLLLNGLTVEHFNRNVNIYKAITAKELQTLAQKYFAKEDFYEIVVV